MHYTNGTPKQGTAHCLNPATGKWEVQAQLQDSSGKIETQTTEFDTLEEAEAAVDRLIEKYPDTSKKQLGPAVCNVGNMDFCC